MNPHGDSKHKEIYQLPSGSSHRLLMQRKPFFLPTVDYLNLGILFYATLIYEFLFWVFGTKFGLTKDRLGGNGLFLHSVEHA